MRTHYERALTRIKADIDALLRDPEPQHKALMEAFKAAQMCTDALAALPAEGTDPFDQLSPETKKQVLDLIAKDLGHV